MGKAVTRAEGGRILLFSGRELTHIVRVSNFNSNNVTIDVFDPNEELVRTIDLVRDRVINVAPTTKLAFYRLTSGRRPHALLCFEAPRSIIILEEEKCRSHALPTNYIVRPY